MVGASDDVVRRALGPEQWLQGLGDYEGADVHRVSELLPEGYDVYLRLFHAFVPWCTDDAPQPAALPRWTWRELAETAGARYGGTLMVDSLAGALEVGGEPMLMTSEGALDAVSRAALFAILADDATTPPGDGRALFWFRLGAVVAGDARPVLYEAPVGAVDTVLERCAAEIGVRGAGRRGSGGAGRTGGPAGVPGPELVWPTDRRWAVATDDDLVSTYVGCSRELAERLLHDDALELVEVDLDTRIDSGADRDQRPGRT